jgi:hypothetical protein
MIAAGMSCPPEAGVSTGFIRSLMVLPRAAGTGWHLARG